MTDYGHSAVDDPFVMKEDPSEIWMNSLILFISHDYIIPQVQTTLPLGYMSMMSVSVVVVVMLSPS